MNDFGIKNMDQVAPVANSFRGTLKRQPAFDTFDGSLFAVLPSLSEDQTLQEVPTGLDSVSHDSASCELPLLTPCSKAVMSQALKATFSGFQKEQRRLGIPKNPWLWSEQQVCQWLLWATNEFSLVNVNLHQFGMNGQMLCNLGKERFLELAPDFVGNSPSNLSSSSETGSGGGTYRQKSMPEGFGVSRRSPASIDRQNTQSDISGSGKSTPSWQRSEDSLADQMEPTCHLPAVSKVLPAFRESPSGRLMRQDPVVHLSPNKQGHSDSHYSSHSSSNTLSSNASSAHSDEKWYDGDRTESDLNSYNYLQGTSADSGIDTASYGPSHGSTASLGASTSSPRSGPGKEKVAPLWHSSSEVLSLADQSLLPSADLVQVPQAPCPLTDVCVPRKEVFLF